jgi:Secretion system C-terminal sorting domain
MKQTTTLSTSASYLLLAAALLQTIASNAQQQTLWLEEFDGGATTTGFWVDSTNVTDCRWEYAPDSVSLFDFNQDFSGSWPAGPGFDSSFVFLDSDACGGTSVVVNSYVTSAPFDASDVGVYVLHYTHQFRARLASFCRIEASPDGITWTEVGYYFGTDVGYPNPAVIDSVDITVATGASANALVRFQFSAGWDWWWALDSVSVTFRPSTLGLAEASDNSVHIFPNPVNDVLNVRYPGTQVLNAEVFDAMGRRVITDNMSRVLAVQALVPGSYVLVLRDISGATVVRTRFVKR